MMQIRIHRSSLWKIVKCTWKDSEDKDVYLYHFRNRNYDKTGKSIEEFTVSLNKSPQELAEQLLAMEVETL